MAFNKLWKMLHCKCYENMPNIIRQHKFRLHVYSVFLNLPTMQCRINNDVNGGYHYFKDPLFGLSWGLGLGVRIMFGYVRNGPLEYSTQSTFVPGFKFRRRVREGLRG